MASELVKDSQRFSASPVCSGQSILTGEASVLYHDGAYYFYMNNWGGCAGIDCCGEGTAALTQ